MPLSASVFLILFVLKLFTEMDDKLKEAKKETYISTKK